MGLLLPCTEGYERRHAQTPAWRDCAVPCAAAAAAAAQQPGAAQRTGALHVAGPSVRECANYHLLCPLARRIPASGLAHCTAAQRDALACGRIRFPHQWHGRSGSLWPARTRALGPWCFLRARTLLQASCRPQRGGATFEHGRGRASRHCTAPATPGSPPLATEPPAARAPAATDGHRADGHLTSCRRPTASACARPIAKPRGCDRTRRAIRVGGVAHLCGGSACACACARGRVAGPLGPG